MIPDSRVWLSVAWSETIMEGPHHSLAITPPRVDEACGRVAGTHGDVLSRHTGTCWDLHTVRFHFFSVPHHTHRTPNTPHHDHTTCTHTQHNRQRDTKKGDRERAEEREERRR